MTERSTPTSNQNYLDKCDEKRVYSHTSPCYFWVLLSPRNRRTRKHSYVNESTSPGLVNYRYQWYRSSQTFTHTRSRVVASNFPTDLAIKLDLLTLKLKLLQFLAKRLVFFFTLYRISRVAKCCKNFFPMTPDRIYIGKSVIFSHGSIFFIRNQFLISKFKRVLATYCY